MNIMLELKETSQKMTIGDVLNTYQKGDMYCIMLRNRNIVYKFPISNIFRITEETT